MSKKAYWELLRDPRWQKMRLEVMQRDDFTCQECNATDKTLNVHHTYYVKGRKPWEYESESLRTLCEACHARVSDNMAEISRLAGQLTPDLQGELIGYLRYTVALNSDTDPDHDVLIPVTSVEHAIGVRVAAGLIGYMFENDKVVCDYAENHDGKVSLWFILGLLREQSRKRQEAVARGQEIV